MSNQESVLMSIDDRIDQLKKEKYKKMEEREKLCNSFQELKDYVAKTGVICAFCFVIYAFIFTIIIENNKGTLNGMSQLLRPVVFFIFLITLVVTIAKGFDLFINSHNKYGIRVAEKLNKNTFAAEYDCLNKSILFLDKENERLMQLKVDGKEYVRVNVNSEEKNAGIQTINNVQPVNNIQSAQLTQPGQTGMEYGAVNGYDEINNYGKADDLENMDEFAELDDFYANLEKKHAVASKVNANAGNQTYYDSDLDDDLDDLFEESSEDMWKREVLRER